MGDAGGCRPWHAVWAKTGRDESNAVTHWLPLHQHLADTAGVVSRLVDEWVSPQVLARLARDLPGGAEGARTVATWLAAVHDVGKASPAFSSQVPTLADLAYRHGLPVTGATANDPQRGAVAHALVGDVAVRDWLIDHLSVSPKPASQLASVVGSHHGVPPDQSQLALVENRADLAGTGSWIGAREELLAWATDLVGGPDVLRRSVARMSLPSQVLLTALVIVADWVAFNADYFPVAPIHTAVGPLSSPDIELSHRRLEAGWEQLDLRPRWCAADTSGVDADALLDTRFGRATGVRPVQRAAVEAARSVEHPGLLIVEAPMGEGKTEAALLAAEVLARRTGADGCFVALPTRATSDAMFTRVLDWVDSLPGREGPVSLTLAHGTASLNDTFRGLLRGGRMASIGEDVGDDPSIAHVWLHGRKKGVLAQFVVGTVDQVLFGGLKSRHLMLRHLGLAGKVVVIDEVHAYDVFMSQYLDRVLHWLGAYGVPVVLLSATLPSARRAELVAAYDSGAGTTSADVIETAYPAIVTSGGREPVAVAPSARPTPVTLTRAGDDLDRLVAILRDRLVDGGCAVVVRNTVGRVQEAADRLVAEFGVEAVTVNHSRFLACDRARIDVELLARFGPPGPEVERPARHVVVASQVVEQSLDVDFDLMVSDLAPVDLLLQRMGRLHRHPRERPGRVREAECVVVGVEDWDAVPVRAVLGARRVYAEHALLRSAALLIDRERIDLPGDIAPLVQSAYGEPTLGPETWQEAMSAAQKVHDEHSAKRQEEARTFRIDEVSRPPTLVGWVSAGMGDADEDPRRGPAQVRDGEETLEVLVVCRDVEGGMVVPPWIPSREAGLPVSFDFPPEHDVARAVAACALRLPLALSHPGVVDGVIAHLERDLVPAFQGSPLLKERLVLVLDADSTAELRVGETTYRLTYDLRRGLLHERV